MKFKQLLFLLIYLGLSSNINAASESAGKIVFGQTAVLSGPTANLGKGIQNGINAAFNEKNQAGGIRGSKLQLITYDDQYEPNLAIENVKKLLETDQVFAMIGVVGTSVANAVLPILSQQQTPLIGTYSGADFLRERDLPFVINIRAAYQQEAEACVAYYVDILKKKKIAVLYQDDTFGRSGLGGVERALKKRGISANAIASYARNTTAVKTALLHFKETDPEAIIIIGVAKPTEEFIRLAKKMQFNCNFATLSAVGIDFVNAIGNIGEGVIISQVVPSPFSNNVPIVLAYQNALKNYDPKLEYDYISLEGYLVARFAITSIEAMDMAITKENYIRTIKEIKDFDVNGIKMHFDTNKNQGMETVFLTIINKDGKLERLKIEG